MTEPNASGSPEDLLRVYLDPAEINLDGYPYAWHGTRQFSWADGHWASMGVPIKDLIREQAGNRCERCGHPYEKGMGEWSPCDEGCTHRGPVRVSHPHGGYFDPFALADTDVLYEGVAGELVKYGQPADAHWRILTVHHLNGIKHDCTWGNLVALCQRCHLTIQGKVWMEKVYDRPHTEWFKPYAAFHYARTYLDEELSRDEVMERLDELLALELRQERLPGV